MPSPNLSFAKIVATPTDSTWSQAYNAGSLFLAVSLFSEAEDFKLTEEGKKFLNTIEAEFFGLEDKTLETIQNAISQALSTIPSEVHLSLSLAFIKDDILYCFLKGEGAVILKRETTRAPLLQGTKEGSDELLSASGHLKTDDLILLETAQFFSLIPEATLQEALEYPLPNDIAETISPHVHNSHEGGASAIILSFQGLPRPFASDEPLISDEKKESKEPEQDLPPVEKPLTVHAPSRIETEPTYAVPNTHPSPFFLARFKPFFAILTSLTRLPRQKQLILLIAILLLLLLAGGVILTKRNQETRAQNALFNELYDKALKEYEEGESLYSLNPAIAREDYLAADKIVKEAGGKFPEDSEEAQKLATLQEKIQKRLGTTETSTTLTATKVELSDSPLLAALHENKDAIGVSENAESIYVATSTEIININKDSGDEETIVENDGTWERAVSVGTYLTNVYLLDTSEGLLKFVPTEDAYASSNYFSSSPNLSQAVSLAIDGSVYLLYKNGTIEKYTRGEKDAFSLSGLETVFKNPQQIVTSSDLEHLYVLDKGNSRIVQIDKTGKATASFQATILKDARAITISADETQAYVLQGGSLYQLSFN